MTTIAQIQALPNCPYNGTGIVGIAITNGVPNYFKVTGSNLDRIVSVNWYPENPASVKFTMRNMILIDNTVGTFMVMINDNFLFDNDRGGHISFRLNDNTTLTASVRTYGRVSIGPLFQFPDQGLITG